MVLPDRTETERLVLRCWEAHDVAVLDALVAANVEHLAPWMPWIRHEPLGPDGRRDLIARWQEARQAGGDAVYGAFLHDGTAIGSCGLHSRLGPDALEIGYWVAADHVRRGYARELSAGLTDLAFTVPGIERVEIHHDIGNVASAGVPRSLGFTDRGTTASDRDDPAPGECGVDRIWSVSRSAWSAR